MRIGFGYDIHRLIKERTLILGRIVIPHTMGEDGHSDGDVLIHTVIDALLGAAGLDDIGTYFPPNQEEFKDISSIILLQRTLAMINKAGYRLNNLDCTIILQQPHLAPFKKEISQSLARTLAVHENSVSVKAKTKEHIGETGAGRAIEAYAAVLLEPIK